jgi:hypothetical protein
MTRSSAQDLAQGPDGAFAATARSVIDGQLRLAERLSEDLAASVLAHVDATHRLTMLLRAALRDQRGSRSTAFNPQSRPPASTGAKSIAADAVIDDLVSRLETALLNFAAEAQRQDAIRQVIDGAAMMAAGVIDAADPPDGPDAQAALVARLDWLAGRFVMEDQRNAYAKAVGRAPEESSARLELF